MLKIYTTHFELDTVFALQKLAFVNQGYDNEPTFTDPTPAQEINGITSHSKA